MTEPTDILGRVLDLFDAIEQREQRMCTQVKDRFEELSGSEKANLVTVVQVTDPAELDSWIQALESGEYEQAKRVLRSLSGYCCLGVFLDVNGDGEWLEASPGNNTYEYHHASGDVSHVVMDSEVWPQYVFTSMNDVYGFSFPEIASCLRTARKIASSDSSKEQAQ